MAAELQGEGETPAHVAQALEQPFCRGADQEVDLAETPCGARPAPAQHRPVEHREPHVALYRLGHPLYMVRGSAARQPTAPRDRKVNPWQSCRARAATDRSVSMSKSIGPLSALLLAVAI